MHRQQRQGYAAEQRRSEHPQQPPAGGMRCKFTRQSFYQVVHSPSLLKLRTVRHSPNMLDGIPPSWSTLPRYLPFSADSIWSDHGGAPICRTSVGVAAKISGLSSADTKIALAGSGSDRRSVRLPSFALNTQISLPA